MIISKEVDREIKRIAATLAKAQEAYDKVESDCTHKLEDLLVEALEDDPAVCSCVVGDWMDGRYCESKEDWEKGLFQLFGYELISKKRRELERQLEELAAKHASVPQQ